MRPGRPGAVFPRCGERQRGKEPAGPQSVRLLRGPDAMPQVGVPHRRQVRHARGADGAAAETDHVQDGERRMSEDFRETGQVNYEAFAGAHGWTIAGRAMARWDQLAEAEQDAWRAAAHEVMQKG